jgi:hypothetical protein
MARLPNVGGDDSNWGQILNDFLSQSHASDGMLKSGSVGHIQLDNSTQTSLNKADSALQKASNFSDINSALIARNNLGLGTAATCSVSNFAGVVDASGYCLFDGSDETASLTVALSASAGKTLWIPTGKTVKTTNIYPAAGTTITGGGTIDLIDNGTHASRSIYINAVDGVTIDGITVVSSNAIGRTGVYGLIRAWQATNLIIRNCIFGKSSSVLIWMGMCDGFLIANNRGGGCYADGIHISRQSTNGRVIGNELNATQDDCIAINSALNDGAVNYTECTDIVIINNICRNNAVAGNGIAINGGRRILVEGNVIESPVSCGINVNFVAGNLVGPTWLCNEITVRGNNVYNVVSPNTGINVGGMSGSTFYRIIIDGNNVNTVNPVDAIYAAYTSFSTFSNNVIKLSTDKNAVHLVWCQYSSVTGNVSQGGGGTSGGVFINNCAYLTIASNICNGCQVGIYELGSTAAIMHIGNVIQGNSSAQYGGTPGATSVAKSNIGYNPRGVQVVSVPASGIAVAVQPYDRNFYITAGASICTITFGASTIATIPANTLAIIRVPAAQVLTATYASAPTWIVYGE